MDVSVVGSLHLDVMVHAPRLPCLDETVVGSTWHYQCGGKGGNQAVAAAQYGARTAIGGRIGADDFGRRLRDNLRSAAVNDDHVGVDSSVGSGMSVAIIEAGGEYGAVIVSGANLSLDPRSIERQWQTLWQSRILLLQNELAPDVNVVAARAARAQGARVILNAAPARTLFPDLAGLVDIVVVNRVEAAGLVGLPVESLESAETAARTLCRLVPHVIVTLGRDGLVLMEENGAPVRMSALPVEAVSSHGAGDCFCGALAARLAGGDSLAGACDFARVAAGLFVATPVHLRRGVTAQEVLARCGTSH